MKKKFIIVILLFVLLYPSVVLGIENGGGTGGPGGPGSNSDRADGGNGCNVIMEKTTNPSDTKYNYRLDLVYVNPGPGGKIDILKTVLTHSNKKTDPDFSGMLSAYKKEIEEKAQKVSVSKVTSGPIMNYLVKPFADGKGVDNLFGDGVGQSDRNKKLEDILTKPNGGFGVSVDQLTKDSNTNHSQNRGESYGYRIIIQKLVWYSVGCDSLENYKLSTRKEMASGIISGFAQGSSTFKGKVDPAGLIGNSYVRSGSYTGGLFSVEGKQSVDYYTTVPDIGIITGEKKCTKAIYKPGTWDMENNAQGNNHINDKKLGSIDCRGKFGDWNDGTGLQILWWDNDSLFKKSDYSIDVACENCKSKIADSKSMVIQDVTNWEAIKKVKNISNAECKGRLKNHFYKLNNNDNFYCREEYHVHYPNENNKIKVNLGRFFTLNAKESDLNKLEDGVIPNFAPIKVTKLRICKGNPNDLNNFKNLSDNEFKNCGGSIVVNYKETNGSYKLENSELVSGVDFSSNISGDTLEQSATFNYTLADNIFRFVRINDGYSVIGNKEKDKTFRDIGVSNLPISMSGSVKDKDVNKIATLSFKYILPNGSNSCKDSYSDMNTVYENSKDNDKYLNCVSSASPENIYKKYSENKMDADESIDDSACVKLYGKSGLGNPDSNVSKCIKARVDNKVKECYDLNNNNNYICDIGANTCNKDNAGKDPYKDMVWDDDIKACVRKCSHVDDKYYDNEGKPVDKNTYENKCCNSSNHEEMGRDWNETTNKCCPSGTPYNPKTGTCGGKPTVCNAGNYASLGRDWNDNEGKCCLEGYKYNANTKKCELPPEDKCGDKSLNCGDKPCCVDCHGKGYCGNGSVDKGTDYCPGKPCVGQTCKDNNCDLIKEMVTYRVIDPTNPFEAQNGEQSRDTGENWCSSPLNSDPVCSGLISSSNKAYNNVVQKTILNKANVSENDAMYTIKLNTSMINYIRNYNSRNDYDDFNLICTSDGQCRSEFLDRTISEAVDKTRSKCYRVGNSSFDTCG